MDWRDQVAIWRMEWFPFRVYEYLGHDDETLDIDWGPCEWHPPFRGPIRWLWDKVQENVQ